MKIYIYNELLSDPTVKEFNELVVAKHNLRSQYQYFLDIVTKLQEYVTTNPNDADYFLVPLFIAAWQFENLDPNTYGLVIDKCLYAQRGRHLLIGTGDFGQRVTSNHEMQGHPSRAYRDKYSWLDERFCILALESTVDLLPQDLAFFPYAIPEIEAPTTDCNREFLCGFKGVLGYELLPRAHIRGGLLEAHVALLNSEGLTIYGPQLTEAESSPTSRSLMRQSTFTLAPAGYGQWTFRMIEALRSGSIPVVLADAYVFPFANKIQWDRYCIRIPEGDIARVPETLKALDPARVVEMQRNIARDSALFTKEACLNLLAEELDRRAGTESANWVLPRMRTPSEMGIICIDITNKCDLACSNCTRLLENQDHFWEMSTENFRDACRSLKGFPGIIAIIGGNPCMHSRFREISEIFELEIPNRRQRGIWTNNAFKHSELLEEKFGAFNLNTHGVSRGEKSLKPLYDKMVATGRYDGAIYEGHSEHAPLLVASSDVFAPKEMWAKISQCDVNKKWSAAIVQNKGKLRAYFCEIAASFDLARNEDHGLPVYNGWWKAHIDRFASQIKKFCPGCGAPAKMKGNLDREEVDIYSSANADIAIKSIRLKKRNVLEFQPTDVNQLGHEVTKYQTNAQ